MALSGGMGSPLLLLAAGLLAGPAAAANLGPGDTFYVGGCYVEVLGCYLDPEGPPGCFNASGLPTRRLARTAVQPPGLLPWGPQ